jgi:hypothetical protein
MKKYRLKTKVLVWAMVALLLSSFHLSAQVQNDRPGGLFGDPVPSTSNGLMNRGRTLFESNINGQGFGATGADITGQTFGTPLNGGLIVLLMAGAGYGVLKTRKNKIGKEIQI